MHELFVTATMDESMRRFVRRVQTEGSGSHTRVYDAVSEWNPSKDMITAPPERWLLIDIDQIDEAATLELIATLAGFGAVRIAVRFSHHTPIATRGLPAALRILEERGAQLLLFYYSDQQMDLLTSVFCGAAHYRVRDVNSSDQWDRSTELDPLLEPARALVEAHGNVSLAMIQRTFGIGYRRADALTHALN